MKIYILYTLLCLFLYSSCGVSEPIFVSNDNLQFKSVKDSIFNFSIDTYIYNPASFNYQLKELIFDIRHEEEKIGYGKLVDPVKIKSNDTVLLPIVCSMNLAQLQKKHKRLLRNENTTFNFIGKATAVHPLKTISKDISVNIHYDVKKVISDNMFNDNLAIGQIEIEKINPFSKKGLSKSNLLLNIEIHNNQFFDFQIEQIELTLLSRKTNKEVLKSFMDTTINVHSLKTVKIPLDIESNYLNVLLDVGRFFLGKGSPKYIGTGFITIRIQNYQFKIPVNKEFNIETNLFGNRASKINTSLYQNC